ncbi:hypothetical protein C8R43DRAFT_957146 [Mycena crocata]|nr:hypothetical protein C8R43DRAFT_957146 [Mycena crocata]
MARTGLAEVWDRNRNHTNPIGNTELLIPFAQHCPDLNTLGLRMNVSNVPDFSQVAGERIVHSLEALYVGTLPINPSKVNEVAAFLSNLFPTLEYLFPYEETAAGRLATHAKNWNRVFAVLPLFCLVRSQEETFWKQQLAGGEDSESSLEDEDEGESDGQSGTLGDAEEVS